MRISLSKSEYKPKDKTPVERTYRQHAKEIQIKGLAPQKEEVRH